MWWEDDLGDLLRELPLWWEDGLGDLLSELPLWWEDGLGDLLSELPLWEDGLGDLLSELLSLGLLDLGHLGGGLVAEAAAAPVLPDLLASLVEVRLHLSHKRIKIVNSARSVRRVALQCCQMAVATAE